MSSSNARTKTRQLTPDEQAELLAQCQVAIDTLTGLADELRRTANDVWMLGSDSSRVNQYRLANRLRKIAGRIDGKTGEVVKKKTGTCRDCKHAAHASRCSEYVTRNGKYVRCLCWVDGKTDGRTNG